MFVNFYRVKLFKLSVFVHVLILYIILSGYWGKVPLCEDKPEGEDQYPHFSDNDFDSGIDSLYFRYFPPIINPYAEWSP